MELKEGVIYVWPCGTAMDKDKFQKIEKQITDMAQKLVEVVVPIVENTVKNIAEFLGSLLKGVIQKVKELISEFDVKKIQKEIDDRRIMRDSWNAPKTTALSHQVIDNKPKFVRIRNHI